jgi:hypothetical protein
MQKIPHNRMILYMLLIGCLPLGFIWWNYRAEKTHLEHIERMISMVRIKQEKQNTKEIFNKATIRTYRGKDPQYLQTHVASIKLLQQELLALQKVSPHSFFIDEESLRKRISFLSGKENTISFTETPLKSSKQAHEYVLSFAHPVELDVRDLQTLLERIEGINPEKNSCLDSRPHLMILECSLQKKKSSLCEAFVTQIKILKRDYIP